MGTEQRFLISVNKAIPIFVMGILILGFVLQPTVFASNEEKEDKTIEIPDNAIQIAPGVFNLGKAKDVDGKTVEGILFIHNKKGFAKPEGKLGNVSSEATVCYAFLSGAKWIVKEPWIVNTANTEGLGGSFIFSNIAANIQKWENAAGIDIIGSGSTTVAPLVADTKIGPDGKNEVYFANIKSRSTIAYTVVWYTFSGQIVEWDQVYNQRFNWTDSFMTPALDKMDFENISTHEIGHTVGMGHPDNSCVDETMYAYSGYGEIKKRDLNSGDIAGIQALY